ncbi:MAG: DUF6350 family protein [Jatrophihabitans sp.]
MPADRRDQSSRLLLTAAWTGLAAALVASMIAIAVVAVVWLPASGGTGSANSAIRAGILTFLASLHGGITVDGVDAAFLPLGLTVLVGLVAWRSGSALAAAADEAGLDDRTALVRAGAVQVSVFAVVCGFLAAFSRLGTSSVSVVSATFAGLVLFLLTGGVAFVRNSVMSDDLAELIPPWVAHGVRVAATVLGIYLGAGALLVAGSIVVHHDRVQALSTMVGGGWSGVPVLLLGILAVPNAAIAGAGYLSGAGFAFGTDTTVGLTSNTHGTVPAFPVLGALPDGAGATLPVWLLAGLTPLLAGLAVAFLAHRATQPWLDRWLDAGVGVATAGVAATILAWQGGGAIGSGRLHAVGASPWQFGLAVVVGVGVIASVALGSLQSIERLRAQDGSGRTGLRATFAALIAVEGYDDEPAAGECETEDAEVDDEQLVGDRDEPRKGKRLAG